MADGFNQEAQAFLVDQANIFPSGVFKKPHSAQPLCDTFTTAMDGLTDEVEGQAADCIVLLDLDLDEHKGEGGLPPIPRKRLSSIPENITCSGDTSGDDSEPSAINKRRIIVLCNLSELIC